MVALVKRVPTAAWWCALIGALNAAGWGLITPPFHIPDEPQHIGYVQHLAETGRPAHHVPAKPAFSTEEAIALDGSLFNLVVGNDRGRPPWSDAQMDPIKARLAGRPRRDNGGSIPSVDSNPPLYYALEVLPYSAAEHGSFFDRIVAMRLLSALLAGVTVLLCFGFVREVLPAAPWAWTVGALAVAFQPTFGFIGGGVSNDNLLFVTSAGILLLLARVLRRGLTMARGASLGAAVTTGLLTKGTTLGLLPGVALGLSLVISRTNVHDRRHAIRAAATAVAVPVVAMTIYVAVSSAVWQTSLYAGAGETATSAVSHGSTGGGLLSYLWQFYLPRLPFMHDQWPGVYPLYDVWFRGFIGRFGWLDYQFPPWVYPVAAAIAVVTLGMCLATLWRARAACALRWAEGFTYAAVVGGLLALIAVAGYRYRLDTGFTFEQARYLLPLLPLYAGFIALAARAARRFGLAVGALLVLLTMAHGVFAELLTLGRYYG